MKLLWEKNYYLAKANVRFLISNLQHKEQLILYQMGKVGSSTIFNSLYSSGLDKHFAIHRAYYLTDSGIKFMGDYVEKVYGSFSKFPNAFKTQIWRSNFLKKKLNQQYLSNHKCKIITFVREPIARNISAFFQTYDWFVSVSKAQYKNNKNEYLNEVSKSFFETYYPHDLPLNWFDDELKNAFKIDVFATDFPKDKGYKIYLGEWVDVLLIKLEKINEIAYEAIEEFLKTKDFKLTKSNVGKNKDYSEVYQDFLSSIHIPESYINQMYGSKYVQHFYSTTEIDNFKRRWLKRSFEMY